MTADDTIPFTNIHAHRLSEGPHEWVLTSLFADDYPPAMHTEARYSVGLHPMHIEGKDVRLLLKKVQLAAENDQVLAIGETGADKLIGTPMEIQMKVFNAQVEIAEHEGLPVIIHAVRSFSELIAFMRDRSPVIPMIIHGYRGSGQMAGDLIDHGFYLSIGHAVLTDTKTGEAVQQIPFERMFLETDEHEADIREIYARVAGIKQIPVEELRNKMNENVSGMFRREEPGELSQNKQNHDR
jgi:TatD DNase family protein